MRAQRGLVFWAVILVALVCPALAGQPSLPDRNQLATVLKEAEGLRARYRVEATITYHYDAGGVVDVQRAFKRLSDGHGRLRREQWTNKPGKPAGTTELCCWDGEVCGVEQARTDAAADQPRVINLQGDRPHSDYLDEIENVLGLNIACPAVPGFPRLSPADAIANPKTPVEITSVKRDGRDLVRVRITGPWSGVGDGYIYEFDPQRDWMLMGLEIRVYGSSEAQAADESYNVMGYTTIRAEQIDGVWTPREVKMLTRLLDPSNPSASWTEYPATMRFDSIDLDPQIRDEEFTVAIETLPAHSMVVDNRLGISYKIGDSLLYADGALHQLAEPIGHVLGAKEMEALLASATPLIDPELANINLKPVGGNGLAWAGRIAGGLTVAMCVGIGFVLYRRRA